MNLNFRFLKKFPYIIIVLIFLAGGCSVKTYNIDTSVNLDNAISLAGKNTPNLCSYKGKVAVNIEAEQNVSFSALLNKKCNDDMIINILGALNNPVAMIKYENKYLKVTSQNKQHEEDIREIANNSILYIIKFLKSPQLQPASDMYNISYDKSSYIFSNQDITILFADENFRLYKYVDNGITAEYMWDEERDILKSIIITSPHGKISVRFLNKAGWSIDGK